MLDRVRQCHEQVAIVPRPHVMARRTGILFAAQFTCEIPARAGVAELEHGAFGAVAVRDEDSPWFDSVDGPRDVRQLVAELLAHGGASQVERPAARLLGAE